MDTTTVDCTTGEEVTRPMTDDELAALQAIQAAAASTPTPAQLLAQQQQAQVQAAQAVIATAADPTQAAALTQFFKTMGLPL